MKPPLLFMYCLACRLVFTMASPTLAFGSSTSCPLVLPNPSGIPIKAIIFASSSSAASPRALPSGSAGGLDRLVSASFALVRSSYLSCTLSSFRSLPWSAMRSGRPDSRSCCSSYPLSHLSFLVWRGWCSILPLPLLGDRLLERLFRYPCLSSLHLFGSVEGCDGERLLDRLSVRPRGRAGDLDRCMSTSVSPSGSRDLFQSDVLVSQLVEVLHPAPFAQLLVLGALLRTLLVDQLSGRNLRGPAWRPASCCVRALVVGVSCGVALLSILLEHSHVSLRVFDVRSTAVAPQHRRTARTSTCTCAFATCEDRPIAVLPGSIHGLPTVPGRPRLDRERTAIPRSSEALGSVVLRVSST